MSPDAEEVLRDYELHAKDCAVFGHCCGNDCRCLKTPCDCNGSIRLPRIVGWADEAWNTVTKED